MNAEGAKAVPVVRWDEPNTRVAKEKWDARDAWFARIKVIPVLGHQPMQPLTQPAIFDH